MGFHIMLDNVKIKDFISDSFEDTLHANRAQGAIMAIINRRLLLLVSSLFIVIIYSHDSLAYEKSFSLSSVASAYYHEGDR